MAFSIHLSSPCLLFALLVGLIQALATERLIYAFPRGTFLENSATRQDGSILVTSLTRPDLILFDPCRTRPEQVTLFNFSTVGYTSVAGITETAPDEFQVVVANNFSLATLTVGRGTTAVYSVKFPEDYNYVPSVKSAPTIAKLTSRIPDAQLLNGLTTLDTHTILAADSRRGAIYTIDTRTGHSRHFISSDAERLLRPTGPPGLGVNGLKIHNQYLYFTNTAAALLARIPIDPRSGTARGSAEVVARPPLGQVYDDFNIDEEGGVLYAAVRTGNEIQRIFLERRGFPWDVVAGGFNETQLVQPTSLTFWKRRRRRGGGKGGGLMAYVTTGAGRLVEVDLSR